jgi:serine/threonine protein kinase
MYKKRKCASSQKLWSLDKKNFEFNKTHVFQPLKSHGGAFPKSYQNVQNKSGRYKNCEVFIKEINKVNLNISKNYELTTEILKRVGGKASNVNFLIGIYEKANCVLLVQPFCSNGSLMDVMQQNPMNILQNFDFKLHVLLDVSKGMSHLHDSLNMPHANLKTSNCLVDSRYMPTSNSRYWKLTTSLSDFRRTMYYLLTNCLVDSRY